MHLGVGGGVADTLPVDQHLGVLATVLGDPAGVGPDAADGPVMGDEFARERRLARRLGAHDDDPAGALSALLGGERKPVHEALPSAYTGIRQSGQEISCIGASFVL